jgi:hypothetical protein
MSVLPVKTAEQFVWAEIKVCDEPLADEFLLLDAAVLQAQVAYIELSSTEQLGELFSFMQCYSFKSTPKSSCRCLQNWTKPET